MFVPEGLAVTDADGQGAFDYVLEDVPGGQLQRPLPEGDLALSQPEAHGVAREVEVSAERIDAVHARTVLSARGREVTELTPELQNRSRHGLLVWLPPGSEATRAARDGQPVTPAEHPEGIVLCACGAPPTGAPSPGWARGTGSLTEGPWRP